ncbi:MAG: NTP transferase domain-containing protein [Propionibacteriaceae bacterium]|nr:NTP transferase domain-containing protein [Propionibacteriaceae bacterium]
MANLTCSQIILAGGRSRRLGTLPKCDLVFEGQTLLAHAMAAGQLACHQVVVGPPDLPVVDGVRLVREDPPFGGPVAGIAAGVRELAAAGCTADWILITACDHPHAEAATAALIANLPELSTTIELVTPTDSTGHRQTLFALYRREALERELARHDGGHNLSVRRLIADLATVEATVDDDLLDDVDDPAAAARHGINLPRKGQPHAPRP